MSKGVWAIFEGILGLVIGAFLGYLLAGAYLMVRDECAPDLPGDTRATRTVIVFLTSGLVGVGFAFLYGKRAIDAYEGHGEPRSIVTGRDGKPGFTVRSVLSFAVLAVAWAFWVLLIQTWGYH